MAIASLADLNRVIQEVNRRQEEDRAAGRPVITHYVPDRILTFEEVPWQYEESSPPPLQAVPQSPPPVVPSASPQQSNLQQLLAVAKGPSTVTIDISGLPGSRDSKLQAVVTPAVDISKLRSGGVLPDLPSELTGGHIDLESPVSTATLENIQSIPELRASSPTEISSTISTILPKQTGGTVDLSSELSQVTLRNIATVSGASRSAARIGTLLAKAKGIAVDTAAIAAALRAASGGKTGEQKIKLKIKSSEPEKITAPRTFEDQQKAAKHALDKYNPSGVTSGANEIIARLAPHLAPGVITGQYNAEDVAAFLRKYEDIRNGYVEQVPSYGAESSDVSYTAVNKPPFDKLSYNDKKEALADLCRDAYHHGLPLGAAANGVLALVESVSDASQKQNLETWARNGGLDLQIKQNLAFSLEYDTKKWLGSQEGQLTVGGVFASLGALGGVVTGGPLGALAGSGTGIFATTELVNFFGMQDFRNKASLQKSGLYPQDIAMSFDSDITSYQKRLDQFSYDKNKMTPEERLTAIGALQRDLDNLYSTLGDKWAFIVATGKYDTVLQRLDMIKSSLDQTSSTIDLKSGIITNEALPPATLHFAYIPDGWRVTVGGLKVGSGKDLDVKLPEGVVGVLEIWDKNGNKYQGPNISLKPGSSPLLIDDVRNFVEKARSYGGGTATEKPPAEVTIGNIPAGWTVSIGSLTFGSGQNVKQTTDHSVSGLLKITDDKGKTYYGNQYTLYPGSSPLYIGDVSDIVNKQKQYEKKEESLPDGKVTIFVPAGYTATYMGKKMSGGEGGASYDITGKAGTQLSILYEAPGKRADTLSTMIPQGGGWKAESKYLEPELARTETPSRGIAALNFEPQQTVYLDGQKLDPTKYGLGALLPAGYHTLVVEEEGYRTASKTVYVPAGESISLSLKGEPVWTSASRSPSYGGAGGGGGGGGYSFVASRTEHAIVIFSQTVEGATVVLDGVTVAPVVGQQYSLTPGYHSVQVSKPGFKTWTKTVYCGAGETTYISPALEPVAGSGGSVIAGAQTTKRLYVNSTPPGAKILVDDRWSGEYSPSYVDLQPGYHQISFAKSGYSIKSIPVFIGETVLTGDAAIAMAAAAGVEVKV